MNTGKPTFPAPGQGKDETPNEAVKATLARARKEKEALVTPETKLARYVASRKSKVEDDPSNEETLALDAAALSLASTLARTPAVMKFLGQDASSLVNTVKQILLYGRYDDQFFFRGALEEVFGTLPNEKAEDAVLDAFSQNEEAKKYLTMKSTRYSHRIRDTYGM